MDRSSASRGSPGTAALAGLALVLVAGACAPGQDPPSELTVVGNDYVFQGPDTLPPGPAVIEFQNQGEVRHEMILIRLTEGTTLEELMEAARSEDADRSQYMEGGLGILIANPGQTAASRLHLDLVPGRTYALICNLTDGPESVPHTQLGMRDSFYVTAAD